jgi:osmotically-inducible protein OsmY
VSVVTTTNRKGPLVSNNATVEHAVRDSLNHDPRIPDPSEVAVTAVDGTVILRGTVGSLSQRRACGIDVRDGWATLTGEVTHQFESDAAYDDIAGLNRVIGITNEIKVATTLGLRARLASGAN